MEKLFLCASSEPFDMRFTGKDYKVFRAASAKEARERYVKTRPRKPEWMAHAVEITEEVLQKHLWVKDIPVSP